MSRIFGNKSILSSILLFYIAVGLVLIIPLTSTSADSVVKTGEIPKVTFNEDEITNHVFNLNDFFSTDSNQISFYYKSESFRIEVEIHDDGYVDFSAPRNWYGMEEVTFIASDGEHEARGSTIVTVSPVNDAPEVISSMPDMRFDEDTTLLNALDLHDYFQDVDSELTFTAMSTDIIVDIHPDGTVDFSAPLNWHGNDIVTFMASDGTDQEDASTSLSIEVSPTNDAPIQLEPISPINLRKEEPSRTIDMSDFFTDVDEEPLTFHAIGNEKVQIDIDEDSKEVTLNVDREWVGRETITLIATDEKGETCSAQVVVVVSWKEETEVNHTFYFYGLVLTTSIVAGRLYLFKVNYRPKSPVKLESYRHYKMR